MLGEADTEALRRHAAGCTHCTAELAMMREFLAPQGGAGEEARAVEKAVAAQRAQIVGAARRPEKGGWWAGVATAWRLPRLVYAGAALLAMVSVGLYWQAERGAELGPLETSGVVRSLRVTGVEPAGDLEEKPVEIRWDALAGAARYRVRLLAVDGEELWRGETKETRLTVPPEAGVHMTFTRTLLWEIEALGEGGKEIAESGGIRFRLTGK
jgi:hypothetical protein